VRTSPGEGIRGAVQRAQRAPGSTPRTFVAVASDGAADLAIDATYAPRSEQMVLDALTLRVRLPLAEPERGLAIAGEVLQSFGGTGYVSFGASRGTARDGFEAIVCFPDVIPWIAQNTVVLPRLLAVADLERWAVLMRTLGISHRRHGRQLELQRYQLRLRPKMRALMNAFESAVHDGFRTSLYAAALPVTRSVRFEQVSRKAGTTLDLAITRGLSRRACSNADLAEIDTFLRAWLGLGLSATAWRVRASGVILPKQAPREAEPRQASAPARPVLRVIEGGRSARA
jgi:hypothetical protein